MSVRARLTNVVVNLSRSRIFAADDRGAVYVFAPDLTLIDKAVASIHSVAIHGLAVDENWIYTRDFAGNLIRWNIEPLAAVDFIVTQHFSGIEIEEGATPAPSGSNAISVIGPYLAVCNAYGTLSLFHRNPFSFYKAVRGTSLAFPEFIGGTDTESVIVADTRGYIYTGSLESEEFHIVASAACCAIHTVALDRKFNRYWATSDRSGGVFLLNEDFSHLHEYRFTNDDVEQLVIDSVNERVYIGCFDHFVHVFSNALNPIEIGCIGPFKFQVNHIVLVDDYQLLVLLESGELHLVDTFSGRVIEQVGGSNALWEVAVNGQEVHGASEAGNIEKFQIFSKGTSCSFERITSYSDLGFGRIRRFAMGCDESTICATTSGSLICIDEGGSLLWELITDGILRDVAVNVDKTVGVVGNEIGELITFDVRSGVKLKRLKNSKPIFCVAFDRQGHIVFGERGLSSTRGEQEPSRLVFLDEVTLALVHVFNNAGNHKRIRVIDNQRILVNGNGTIQIQIIDTMSFEIVQTFNDWVINTPEDALIVGETLYVITYGYQLIAYDLKTSKTLDVQFVAEGYPKSLQLYINDEKIPFLIVGGRNCLMSFRIDNVTPELVCTRYLFDTLGGKIDSCWEAPGAITSNVKMLKPQRIFERTNAF